MNLSKLNGWLILISNVGVLIGIAIVIVELDQNRTALQAEVTWAHTDSITGLNLSLATDGELAEIVFEMNSLTLDEYMAIRSEGGNLRERRNLREGRYSQYLAARFNYYQARYYTETSEPDRQLIRTNIAITTFVAPAARYYWSLPGVSSLFRSEFREFVDNILDEEFPGFRNITGNTLEKEFPNDRENIEKDQN